MSPRLTTLQSHLALQRRREGGLEYHQCPIGIEASQRSTILLLVSLRVIEITGSVSIIIFRFGGDMVGWPSLT